MTFPAGPRAGLALPGGPVGHCHFATGEAKCRPAGGP